MPKTHGNGINLYFEEMGDGTPILCIHGTSGSALPWRDASKELAKLGRCIIYDRRGCFRSDRPEPYETTDVGEQADDAAGLLDALSTAPAVVIGRSYGGEIAVDLARRYPEKVIALALLEPALLTLDPEAVAWSQPLADMVLEAGAEDTSSVAEVFLRAVVGDEAWESFPSELKQMFIGNGPAILAEFRGGDLDIAPEELREIHHPTLVVSSKESPEVFRRVDDRLVTALPSGETTLLEGGHLINPAHPVVLDFVERFVTPHST